MIKNILGKSAIETPLGFKASEINQDLLIHNDLPKQIRDEIPTMNKFGYMKEEFDEFTFEFIEYAYKTKGMVVTL